MACSLSSDCYTAWVASHPFERSVSSCSGDVLDPPELLTSQVQAHLKSRSVHMTLARVLVHMQIKELEDGLAAARQSSAHLQTQLDAASASAQSQTADLTSAQAQVSQLRTESESLQSQLFEAQRDWQAAKDTCQAQEAAAANQAQQWTVKVNAVVRTYGQCVVHAHLLSNSSKQQWC